MLVILSHMREWQLPPITMTRLQRMSLQVPHSKAMTWAQRGNRKWLFLIQRAKWQRPLLITSRWKLWRVMHILWLQTLPTLQTVTTSLSWIRMQAKQWAARTVIPVLPLRLLSTRTAMLLFHLLLLFKCSPLKVTPKAGISTRAAVIFMQQVVLQITWRRKQRQMTMQRQP